ncbi:MobC family plasmid mobilization relaxosome protein [Streptomyces sp. NBC_01310]|uniref:plasmid mobilization relaxosome protein MobC n=1 Tax=Streptomyces sp. NBC_01310 TaxID=2903820 RepID=UPI0035B6AA2E|nr:MobC family plasmid mobilization relaxosome protein [Streptomyces sp. NBC_01310]
MSSTPVGSTTHGDSAPGEAGPVRHQGAPDRGDAAEGGPHPQEEKHSCHNPFCAHRAAEQPSVRNRLRKPAADKRVHLITSRFNNSEKQNLLDAAAASAMTLSGFQAHAALAAARDLSRTAAEVAGEREMLNELFALRRHLGQIGNNVNQVAKALNSGADAPHAEAVLTAVRRAAQRVDEFTRRHVEAGDSTL